MRSTAPSATKNPVNLPLGGSTAPATGPCRQRNNLNIFTLDLRASTITKTTVAFTNQNMNATRINLPNGEIIGYDGLDHNKVVQRREDTALTNPIAHHRTTLGISILALS